MTAATLNSPCLAPCDFFWADVTSWWIRDCLGFLARELVRGWEDVAVRVAPGLLSDVGGCVQQGAVGDAVPDRGVEQVTPVVTALGAMDYEGRRDGEVGEPALELFDADRALYRHDAAHLTVNWATPGHRHNKHKRIADQRPGTAPHIERPPRRRTPASSAKRTASGSENDP